MKSRQKGKKKGSAKERVFGCDLQEHLQHSGQEGGCRSAIGT
ncbi:ARHGAP30 isoform 7 [Pan troglodytes]|uniref:Rho GTPase activating protein 30 n=2 Tax=Homininae TaxID=207598 RepID=E9PLA4_HUMAN|nr:ARHGAP30 isoform 7 [Pan troglodytes]